MKVTISSAAGQSVSQSISQVVIYLEHLYAFCLFFFQMMLNKGRDGKSFNNVWNGLTFPTQYMYEVLSDPDRACDAGQK